MTDGTLTSANARDDCINNDNNSFSLPEAMTIETIETLAADFKQHSYSDNSRVVLDASQLEALTTPGLQLIVSLQKTLAARGGELCIAHMSDANRHVFQLAGLENLLNHPMASGA